MVTSRPAPSALPVPFVNKIEYTPQLVVRGSTGKGANGDGGGLKLSETGCREDNGNAQRRAPKHRGYCPREALFSPGRNGPVDHAGLHLKAIGAGELVHGYKHEAARQQVVFAPQGNGFMEIFARISRG